MGCGGSSPEPAPSAPGNAEQNNTGEAQQTQGEASVTPPASSTATTSDTSPFTPRTDPDGRKWLTAEVPYDVFPGLPSAEELMVARANGAAAGPVDLTATSPAIPGGASGTMAEPATPPATPPADTAMAEAQPKPAMPNEPSESAPAMAANDSASPAEASAGEGWAKWLPVEVLRNEIALVNNRLARNLLTSGSYNSTFEEISQDGWVLSALATIASQHPEEFSWKANALLLRDVSVNLAMAATARGRAAYQESGLAGEQITAILNNNSPAGLEEPDPEVSLEETADRASLMHRMESAQNRLKELGGDQAALKTNAEEINREARVLAALARFTAEKDYGSAENADYQAAADSLAQAGLTLAESSAEEDLAAYQAALDQAATSCTNCHEKYRFGE